MYKMLRKLSKSLIKLIHSVVLPALALRCGLQKKKKSRRKSSAKEDRLDSSLMLFLHLLPNCNSLNINRDLPLRDISKTTNNVKVVAKEDIIQEVATNNVEAEVAREVVTLTVGVTEVVDGDIPNMMKMFNRLKMPPKVKKLKKWLKQKDIAEEDIVEAVVTEEAGVVVEYGSVVGRPPMSPVSRQAKAVVMRPPADPPAIKIRLGSYP